MSNTELKLETKDSKEVFQLVQLTFEQINADWEAISEGIDSALPPIADEQAPDRMEKVLSALMDGRMQCWLLSLGEEPYVLMTVTITQDNMSGTKNLCLYSLYGYHSISYHVWHLLLKKGQDIARKAGCNKIIAYSSLPRVLDLVKVLGGDTSYHLITLEV